VEYLESPSWKNVVATIVIMTIGFGFVIYAEHGANDPHYWGAFSGYALILLIFVFGVVTADLVRGVPNI
jgi:hypothetical protein